ncbi:ribosome-recycling factor, mitochondrial [Athalia rosae]|uniref:ribosome-recycling factor, mitochondrial n=1 Tax=Athalia rosae TaxID=37344 RepID=UPI002033777A|nr:ribosome-recycling factor, mitochondrial [Athalia rosae]
MVNLGMARELWICTRFARNRLTLLSPTRKTPEISTSINYSHRFGCTEFYSKNKTEDRRLPSLNLLSSVPTHGIASSAVSLAKNKDRGKEKKGSAKVQVNLNELSQVVDVDHLTSQMQKALDGLKTNYTKNLTLRSSIGAIEELPVTFEGREYKLQELAQTARKPKMVVINISAFPQAIPNIIKAISKSGMNLNPQQDGTTLFVPTPKITKEHREKLAKNAKTLFIEARDHVKDIQLRCIKSLKNKPGISEDTLRSTQTQIQALADKYISEADEIFKTKHKELLGDSE